MTKKVLISGCTGQVGAHLAQLLLKEDYEVYGLIRRVVNRNLSNLEWLGIDQKIKYVHGDLTDECSLITAIKDIQPDEVYNLAAQSHVQRSWDYPVSTAEIDALGVLKFLNAIKNHCPHAKFYQSSTSEMYGNNYDENGQSETTAFHPRSPYSIAKLYAHWMTINYRESYNLFTCCGIMFNNESPLRGLEFVTRKITDGVVRIKKGLSDHISLGNLDAKRDWGFSGDYVIAIHAMLQQDKPEEFVIATGETHSIREFLDHAFAYVNIYDWEKYVKVDPAFLRPADVFTLKGDASKAKKILGWEPKVTFEKLVEIMMEADMKRYSK